MPRSVSADRSGRRSMLRRVIRIAGLRSRSRPARSASVGRYRAGAGGRIASAGASRTAVRTARQRAADRRRQRDGRAPQRHAGGISKRYDGKWKNSAYRPVTASPNQKPTPSADDGADRADDARPGRGSGARSRRCRSPAPSARRSARAGSRPAGAARRSAGTPRPPRKIAGDDGADDLPLVDLLAQDPVRQLLVAAVARCGHRRARAAGPRRRSPRARDAPGASRIDTWLKAPSML